MSYSISESGLAAYGAAFFTNDPDGFYVQPGPEKDQILIREVSDGFVMPVLFDRYKTSGTFYPMLTGAVLQLSEQLKDKQSLEQENKLLKEQLAIARQQQFGTSSEQQPTPEKQETADVQTEHPPAKEKQPKLRLVNNAGRKPLPEHLPRDTVLHELAEADRGCPCCGKTMRDLGEEITEQLTVIPAQYRVKRHVRKKYACRDCGKVVTTSMSKSMVPGSSYASPEFLSHVACYKYQFGLPFYRQETIFEQSGLPFNRTTLANLMNTCADQLTPLIQALKDELLRQKIIHADETTIQVLKEEGRKAQSQSYLWHYRSAASAAHQVVLFDYQKTRAGEHPRTYLNGFKGYLHVDGYSGYNHIPDTQRVGCMAHVRRKFVEATKAIPEGHGEYSHAKYAIDTIGVLYGIERKLTDQPPKIKFEARQQESIPILLKFKKWLDDMKPKVLPKSALGKAIHYAVEQWSTLLRYAENGGLSIDNNIAEREIKQVVIGRKNWLFADTADGAYTNAVMYSLVQTARANGLDPYAYLQHVFALLPNMKTAEEVIDLLPWKIQIAKKNYSEALLAA